MENRKTWFEEMLDSVKDSFTFRLETIILNITEQISKRMKEKQTNRVQLAKALNVSPAAVTRVLRGNSNFTLKTLLTLGDVLDLNLEVNFTSKITQQVQFHWSSSVYASSVPLSFVTAASVVTNVINVTNQPWSIVSVADEGCSYVEATSDKSQVQQEEQLKAA